MTILTKSQELRFYGETLGALKELVEAPESKDLINNIQLGKFGLSTDYHSLYLTNIGLREYLDNQSVRNVEPSIELIKKYNLSYGSLVDLLARLKA